MYCVISDVTVVFYFCIYRSEKLYDIREKKNHLNNKKFIKLIYDCAVSVAHIIFNFELNIIQAISTELISCHFSLTK